jgi:hypothetical protein
MSTHRIVAAVAAGLALVVAGCGASSADNSSNAQNPNAPEVSPPGDIPDNQAFVAYTPPGAGYSVKVPEGWARTSSGGAVTFTDKLNSITMEAFPAQAPPTVSGVKGSDLPKLAKTVNGFQAGKVTTVTRNAGKGVLVTYLADSKASPVTGKVGSDAVERYVFFHRGKDVVLTLQGPKGADNVDPWRIVTDSLRYKA